MYSAGIIQERVSGDWAVCCVSCAVCFVLCAVCCHVLSFCVLCVGSETHTLHHHFCNLQKHLNMKTPSKVLTECLYLRVYLRAYKIERGGKKEKYIERDSFNLQRDAFRTGKTKDERVKVFSSHLIPRAFKCWHNCNLVYASCVCELKPDQTRRDRGHLFCVMHERFSIKDEFHTK